MNNQFLKWKANRLLKPFSDDNEYFRENYGVELNSFCKDLFKELLELDARLAVLENRADEDDSD